MGKQFYFIEFIPKRGTGRKRAEVTLDAQTDFEARILLRKYLANHQTPSKTSVYLNRFDEDTVQTVYINPTAGESTERKPWLVTP